MYKWREVADVGKRKGECDGNGKRKRSDWKSVKLESSDQ